MDRTAFFRSVLGSLLAPYAEQKYSYGPLVNHLIIDEQGKHFLVITEGWENQKHIHHILLHLLIGENKIYLIRNATERDLEAELLEHGVQPEEIVPAHLPPSLRHLVEYVAA